MKLLGVKIDRNLNVNLHIIYGNANHRPQTTEVTRLNKFINFNSKTPLIQSFLYSTFDCWFLFWSFTTVKYIATINDVEKIELWVFFDDYENNYKELLAKTNKPKMTGRRL